MDDKYMAIIRHMRAERYDSKALARRMRDGDLIGAKVACFVGIKGGRMYDCRVVSTAVSKSGHLLVSVRIESGRLSGALKTTRLQRILEIEGEATRRSSI